MAGTDGRGKQKSERERIKKITDRVHPEYDPGYGIRENEKKPSISRKPKESAPASDKRRSSAPGKAKGDTGNAKSAARRTSSKKSTKRKTGMKTGSGPSTKNAKIKRKKKRKAKVSPIPAVIIAAVIAVAIIFVGFPFIHEKSLTSLKNSAAKSYQDGDYQAAADKLHEALNSHLDDPDIYTDLAMAYSAMGDEDKADEYLETALQYAHTGSEKAFVFRAYGLISYDKGDYDRATAYFKTALAESGVSRDLRVDILKYKASSEEHSDNFNQVINTLTELISYDSSPENREIRGKAFYRIQDYNSAIMDFKASIAGGLKGYSQYIELYEAQIAQGDTKGAEETLTEVLSLEDEAGAYYFLKGIIHMKAGRLEEARDELENAQVLGYKLADLGLAELYVQKGEYTNAKRIYDTYISGGTINSLDVNTKAKIFSQYSKCLLNLGDSAGALSYIQSAIELADPDTKQTLAFNLICVYENLGRWNDAYNAAANYVSAYPDDDMGMKEYTFLSTRI